VQSVTDDGDVAMVAHFSDKTAVPAPTPYLKITAVLDTNQYGRSSLKTQSTHGRLSTNILLIKISAVPGKNNTPKTQPPNGRLPSKHHLNRNGHCRQHTCYIQRPLAQQISSL
jgi:hypothetical protein